jgi:hypothetical protein
MGLNKSLSMSILSCFILKKRTFKLTRRLKRRMNALYNNPCKYCQIEIKQGDGIILDICSCKDNVHKVCRTEFLSSSIMKNLYFPRCSYCNNSLKSYVGYSNKIKFIKLLIIIMIIIVKTILLLCMMRGTSAATSMIKYFFSSSSIFEMDNYLLNMIFNCDIYLSHAESLAIIPKAEEPFFIIIMVIIINVIVKMVICISLVPFGYMQIIYYLWLYLALPMINYNIYYHIFKKKIHFSSFGDEYAFPENVFIKNKKNEVTEIIKLSYNENKYVF